MKLNDAIRIADELRDNAISEAQKLIWINELEMKIQSLILHTAPDDMIVYEQVDDTELLVPRPFDKVYYLWLAAMIDYGNAEYDKYQNDKAMADAAYSDYAKWFMRHFHDDCGNVMYIGGTTKYGLSAYQIAVNHGFEGTEAEWILSLNGKDAYEVAVEKGYQGSEDEFYAQLGVLHGIEERVSADAAAAEAAADRTEAAADRVETAALHAPKVENGNWWVYDAAHEAYKDTGVQAQGPTGEPGNGIQFIMHMGTVQSELAGVAVVEDTYRIFFDNGSTFDFKVKGGQPGLKGEGIRDISFIEETEEGYLYNAYVGMQPYPIMVPRGPKGADGKETVLFVQDDEPAEAKVGDLWFDTDEEVDEPSGGASSWNDLTDKPFVSSNGDTLKWDGDTTGLTAVNGGYFKVSDATVTSADLANGCSMMCGGTSVVANIVNMGDGMAAAFDSTYAYCVTFVTQEGVGVDMNGFSFPEVGVYFAVNDAFGNTFVSSLTINGYTGFKTETINASCIPDTIQRTITGTPGDFVVIGEDGKATTGEPPAGGEACFPKFELLHSHVVSEEESTSVVGWNFGKNEIPNLNDYNVFVVTLRSPDGSTFTITAWLKLRINNANLGEISGLGRACKSYAVAAHRLFGVWVSNAIYNPQSEAADLLPVIHRHNVFTSTVDASTEVTNIGLYSYLPNFGVIPGAIIDIYGAK